MTVYIILGLIIIGMITAWIYRRDIINWLGTRFIMFQVKRQLKGSGMADKIDDKKVNEAVDQLAGGLEKMSEQLDKQMKGNKTPTKVDMSRAERVRKLVDNK